MRFLLLMLLAAPLTGCYRPLFDEKLPRHQFEDYDTARHGATQPEVYDLFGNPQPNLRQRLAK